MQSFGKLSLERRTQRTVSSVSSTQNGFGINPVLFYSTNINMSEVSLCLELPDNHSMTKSISSMIDTPCPAYSVLLRDMLGSRKAVRTYISMLSILTLFTAYCPPLGQLTEAVRRKPYCK